MIDTENIREYVVQGLRTYLGIPVIRSNQNEEPPPYPYASYTITTLESQNNGTYGEYADGVDRNPVKQVWSLSFLASTNEDSVAFACKAKEWFEHVGTFALNEHDVIVESCTNITNRDNFLSVEYEYKNGFDVVFWGFSEVGSPTEANGYIEVIQVGDNEIAAEGEEMSYILQFPDGSEYVAVVVGEETVFTATANDIRKDKVAGTEKGVTVGTKFIPTYHTSEGIKIIPSGEQLAIPLKHYDYTKLQAIVCEYDGSLADSVISEKVVIEDNVYAVQSAIKLSKVTIDSENKTIVFGLVNSDSSPKAIRYFTYKEIE